LYRINSSKISVSIFLTSLLSTQIAAVFVEFFNMAAVAQPLPDSLAEARQAQVYLQDRLKSTSATTSFRSIPIIDLTPSFSSSLADRQAVANEIHDACTTVGFFYIKGHGIPQSVCDDVLKLAERFFHKLPEASKEAIHMKNSKQFRGYEPASYSSVNDFASKETKEAFNWGYESGLDPTGGDGKYVEIDGSSDGTKNQWPSETELPGFYKGIAQYYAHVSLLNPWVSDANLDARSCNCLDTSAGSLPSPSPFPKSFSNR
jgi:hypothetical protein